MKYDFKILIDGLSSYGIAVTEEQLEQLSCFYEMMIEKNKVMNLTGITDFSDVLVKHYLDSLSLCKVADLQKSLQIIDLGTGAGFPGIPLKIIFPNLNLTLMDSLNKRILFLQDVIDQLGLHQIKAVHARAEEAAKNKIYRQQYDLCVSRAVASINTLSEYCLPFVKVGGQFIAYKSVDIDQELSTGTDGIRKLGGDISYIDKFCLPGTDYHRSFIVIDKITSTPKQYPRKAGTPLKNPL